MRRRSETVGDLMKTETIPFKYTYLRSYVHLKTLTEKSESYYKVPTRYNIVHSKQVKVTVY